MDLSTVQHRATSETIEALPRLSMTLAAPQQGMSPSATDFAAETCQTLQVAGDGMVVVVEADDSYFLHSYRDNRKRPVIDTGGLHARTRRQSKVTCVVERQVLQLGFGPGPRLGAES
ncbi:hypothetical protein UU5_14163 [Rhodanobacter sp. 115]|nr:hypothetical protein UU5_14163 [Rhodanobacter sp. 115]